MKDRFNMDGGIFGFLTKVFDVMYVSVLWTLFCLPIVTIGPATTALYYTSAKCIRKGEGYIWKEFWHSFKTNLVTGIIYTVILAAVVAVLVLGFGVTKGTKDDLIKVVRYIYIMVVFIVGCCYSFLFPILSRFTLPRFQMMKMSLFISLRHFPVTIVLLLFLLGGATVLVYAVPLLILIPGIVSLLCSLLIEKVFKRYLPKPEEGTPIDELKWYQTF